MNGEEASGSGRGKMGGPDPTEEAKPWVEKYRPKQLSDVAAHKDIVDTIERLTNENRLPHLLLYGPPGTGKTSTILAVARKLYGSTAYQNMTLELNASDDRGIDVVRQEIQDFASTRRIFSSGFKLVILDECDAMTKDAQFALRRIIEKYTRNTRFCLICNYVNKIIPALQSRCTKFRFAPLDQVHVQARLEHVVNAEGLKITPDGLEAVCRLGAGDMRKTLNILQSTHLANEEIGEDAVYATTGNPRPKDVEQVANWLLNEDLAEGIKRMATLQVEKGLALADIVRELHPWVFRINIPAAARMELVESMADIEYRLAHGTNERLQMGALVGAFTNTRAAIVAAAT